MPIKCINNMYRISQYADDSYLFVNDVESLDNAIDVISYLSGRINTQPGEISRSLVR